MIKRLLKFAVLVAIVAAIAYVLRDHLVPAPERPTKEPPPFRVAPEPPPQPAPPAEEEPEEAAAAPAPTHTEDLTDIKGIGPVYFGRLVEAGITTLAGLAAAAPADVAAWAGVSEDAAGDWIEQAKALGG